MIYKYMNLQKRFLFIAGILQICSFSFGAPVSWPISEGGNGHFYEVRSTVDPITWNSARSAATRAGGYLATITSAEENAFVTAIVATDGEAAHIGGIQPEGSREPSGGWSWLTGESFSYSNWDPIDREPSNSGPLGEENRLQIYTSGYWNDINAANANYFAYVIEYDSSYSALTNYQHNPDDGLFAIKDLRTTDNGQFTFTFSTSDPGGVCLVSWSADLSNWTPLFEFVATSEGTEVVDSPKIPAKFYRTSYQTTSGE